MGAPFGKGWGSEETGLLPPLIGDLFHPYPGGNVVGWRSHDGSLYAPMCFLPGRAVCRWNGTPTTGTGLKR
jgi:hypothetical protein